MPSVTHPSSQPPRTLLLSPPSLSAHPELLDNIFLAHDRAHSDIQMLDRLALNLVSLPPSTYDLILILTDADGTRTESQRLLSRATLVLLSLSLQPGGHLKSQDGLFAAKEGPERNEVILAGLLIEKDGSIKKPETAANMSVPLRLGKRKGQDQNGTGITHYTNGSSSSSSSTPTSAKPKPKPPPAGVGFIDFSDDLDLDPEDEEEEEYIDEDTLLTEEDLLSDIAQRKHTMIPKPKAPLPLTNKLTNLQPPNAPPNPVNAAAPAKTVPAALPPNSKPKTPLALPKQTPTSRPCTTTTTTKQHQKPPSHHQSPNSRPSSSMMRS